jgi:hypothetical protein
LDLIWQLRYTVKDIARKDRRDFMDGKSGIAIARNRVLPL